MTIIDRRVNTESPISFCRCWPLHTAPAAFTRTTRFDDRRVKLMCEACGHELPPESPQG